MSEFKCYTCGGKCKGERFHRELEKEIEEMNKSWGKGTNIEYG